MSTAPAMTSFTLACRSRDAISRARGPTIPDNLCRVIEILQKEAERAHLDPMEIQSRFDDLMGAADLFEPGPDVSEKEIDRRQAYSKAAGDQIPRTRDKVRHYAKIQECPDPATEPAPRPPNSGNSCAACSPGKPLSWLPISIEGFWGLAKVRLAKFKGFPQHTFHLHLKESEWRYNHRRDDKYHTLLRYLRENSLS